VEATSPLTVEAFDEDELPPPVEGEDEAPDEDPDVDPEMIDVEELRAAGPEVEVW
jgi:hypothetical protein